MKHPTYQAMPTVSKIHKYPTFHHVYLWQRSLYGVGYYRHLSLHKGTNQLLEGPECQTDLCKITTTLWSRSLRLKSSKLQLHLIYAWSWSNQSSQGPRSSDLGFLFKSTASTTHRKNGSVRERKKERKKERNQQTTKGNIPTTYPSTTQWWARDLIALILAVWTWASHLHVNMTHFPLFLSLLLNITWQQLNQAQAFSDNCFR